MNRAEWEAFVRNAETLLAEVPDAYHRKNRASSAGDWMEANRDELITYQDGSHEPAILSSEVHKDEVPGCIPLLPGNGRKRREAPEGVLRQGGYPLVCRSGHRVFPGGRRHLGVVSGEQHLRQGKNKYGDFSPALSEGLRKNS